MMSLANVNFVLPLNTLEPTNLNVLFVILYLSIFSLTSYIICPNFELVNRNLSNLVKPVMPAPSPFRAQYRQSHSRLSRPCTLRHTLLPLFPNTLRHLHRL